MTMPDLPTEPPVMHQRWHDLLFAHWPIPADDMQRLLPDALMVDTWDGEAWVAVVPFRMTHINLRGLPPVPLTHAMLEFNVRTYVTYKGVPGVWFFSLDASNRLIVEVARGWYNLPYFNAGMHLNRHSDTVYYAMHRTDRRANPALFAGSYWPTSDVFFSQPGTLESWLTERYYLYAIDRNSRVYRGRIHHAPWPLQHAGADMHINSATASHGINLPATPPLLHFSRTIQVKAWPITLAD